MKSNRATRFITNRILPWIGLVLALLLALFAIWSWLGNRSVSKQPIRFVAAAGSLNGTRAAIARQLDSGLRRFENVSLELKATDGSVESLDKVNLGQCDVALVQGGLHTSDYPNVELLAVLHVEPLHLLVKGESLFDEVSSHLEALRGKRINLSRAGSGTRKFALELLTFANLKPEADFEVTAFSYSELMAMSDEDLPDAVFTVSTQPSKLVRHLISHKDFHLVRLPYAESLRINGLFSADSLMDRKLVTRTSIPSFLYSLDPPRPPTEVATMGVPLLVVANRNSDPEGIRRTCEFIYDRGFAASLSNEPGFEALANAASPPLHAGATRYLESKQPASTRQFIETSEQLLAIVGSSLGAFLFLWQWWKRRKEKRRDREFIEHIQRIVEIENTSIQYESLENITVDDLLSMQQELADIKTKLLQRFKTGELEGADMLSDFLKHVNDTSELISQIVLHEVEPKHNQKAGSMSRTASVSAESDSKPAHRAD